MFSAGGTVAVMPSPPVDVIENVLPKSVLSGPPGGPQTAESLPPNNARLVKSTKTSALAASLQARKTMQIATIIVKAVRRVLIGRSPGLCRVIARDAFGSFSSVGVLPRPAPSPQDHAARARVVPREEISTFHGIADRQDCDR